MLAMPMGPRLEIRQSQSLVMTPQLRQAIKLLQCSNLEVAEFVEQELERNPLLERDDAPDFISEFAPERPAPDQAIMTSAIEVDSAQLLGAGTMPAEAPVEADFSDRYEDGAAGRAGASGSFEADERGIDDLIEAPRSLREHLTEQLRLGFPDAADRIIGAQLIALLDPAGRVAIADEDLAAALGTETTHVAAVRARMQQFEPVGLFARDLRDCLAAQLRERNRLDPAMEALLDNLDLLARRDMRSLLAICEVDAEDLADMVAELRALDPKPAAGFDTAPLQPIIPDVLMRAMPDGSWHLELNPETLPRVLVNQRFHARVRGQVAREDRPWLAEQFASANWLVKSLQQRAETILKVAAETVRRQDGFFRHGIGHLRPLILRDVAEGVEMHESTVSRVTANKYIATPRGIFELKYFFTTAIAGTDGETHSAEAVRSRIRSLVNAETANAILSDDAIVAALRREGVDIARRTVAKYRDALRIPSSVQRKREKAVPA
jgi:RNA polymerase sigma-54 factor